MIKHYEAKADQTLDMIHRLHQNGIKKISIILRHSERFYSDNPDHEAFMNLTDKGKDLAFHFGGRLPATLVPHLRSSFIGRCIETAYLIDKGFTATHGLPVEHTRTTDLLSPFYVRDVDKVINHLDAIGDEAFLRKWFDNKIDTDIIDNPIKTADKLCQILIAQLDKSQDNQITIGVTHDWNIYPIREFKLNQPLETTDKVGYMEGVLCFRKQKRIFIQGIQSDPVPLS